MRDVKMQIGERLKNLDAMKIMFNAVGESSGVKREL